MSRVLLIVCVVLSMTLGVSSRLVAASVVLAEDTWCYEFESAGCDGAVGCSGGGAMHAQFCVIECYQGGWAHCRFI